MKISKNQWEYIGKLAGWNKKPDLQQKLSKRLDILNKTAIVELGEESEEERRIRALQQLFGVDDIHGSYNSFFKIDNTEILLFKAFKCASCGTLCCNIDENTSSITRDERHIEAIEAIEAALLRNGLNKLDMAPEDSVGQYCQKCTTK